MLIKHKILTRLDLRSQFTSQKGMDNSWFRKHGQSYNSTYSRGELSTIKVVFVQKSKGQSRIMKSIFTLFGQSKISITVGI